MAMSGNTFEVVFNGKVVEGASVDQVKQNVAKLFKVEVAKVERLFSGARVVIKKGVDESTAKKYQMALHKAGAICAVVNSAQAAKPAAPAASAPQPAAAPRTDAKASAAQPAAAPGDAGLTKYVVKEAPQSLGELGSAQLDEPGVVLIKHEEVAPPQIDTSDLSLDQPGATLVEHQAVAEPAVDISGISMAEPGADIGEASEQTELVVDISGLTMDEPGVVLIEGEEVPEPEIDISKLSVE